MAYMTSVIENLCNGSNDEPMFDRMHAVGELFERVTIDKWHRFGDDDRTDVDTLVGNPVDHDPRLGDIASPPRLERPLDCVQAGELPRLGWMQVDHGEGGADLGTQDSHPTRQHNHGGFE